MVIVEAVIWNLCIEAMFIRFDYTFGFFLSLLWVNIGRCIPFDLFIFSCRRGFWAGFVYFYLDFLLCS